MYLGLSPLGIDLQSFVGHLDGADRITQVGIRDVGQVVGQVQVVVAEKFAIGPVVGVGFQGRLLVYDGLLLWLDASCRR